MQSSPRNSGHRVWVICVDGYDEQVPSGSLYDPFHDQVIPFQSLVELIKSMEQRLSGAELPQTTPIRRFTADSPQQEPALSREDVCHEGKMATFSVQVIFQQNASWQGLVTWLEKEEEQSFRSALELFVLMDSALRSSVSHH